MATVPFGLAAAVLAMFLTGTSINIYSQIGLVLLIGIMAKNGILVVEFAEQLRDRGLAVREAIESAARVRLRPIVMTMISTALGGLPLILSGGPGAKPARPSAGWCSAASGSRRSSRSISRPSPISCWPASPSRGRPRARASNASSATPRRHAIRRGEGEGGRVTPARRCAARELRNGFGRDRTALRHCTPDDRVFRCSSKDRAARAPHPRGGRRSGHGSCAACRWW